MFVTQLLQGVVLSTFIVAVSRPEMLGTVTPSETIHGISVKTLAVDSADTHPSNPLLHYVMTTDRGMVILLHYLTYNQCYFSYNFSVTVKL